MKNFKPKLEQIKKSLPILTTSCVSYILCGFVSGYVNSALGASPLKTLILICFFVSFGIFAGTIISLMDLKYLGKRFMEE